MKEKILAIILLVILTACSRQDLTDMDVLADDDDFLGPEDAKVVVVEFSDFECPFCKRWNDATKQQLIEQYVDTGKVFFVYQDFPLSSHHNSQSLALAARCAGEQNKFWEYHDLVFANQGSLDIGTLKQHASQLGLDTGKFNSCLDNGDAISKVSQDTKEAAEAGGRGTPYFVLVNQDGDTQVVSGAVPWANFEAALSSL